jgi:hypothetical protein
MHAGEVQTEELNRQFLDFQDAGAESRKPYSADGSTRSHVEAPMHPFGACRSNLCCLIAPTPALKLKHRVIRTA